MGRHRATRRNGLQQAKRFTKERAKDQAEFNSRLLSRGELEIAFQAYHEKYIEPLVDFLNWRLSPWYKRAWWALQDSWRTVVARWGKKAAEPAP